jgi:hypothetical protein
LLEVDLELLKIMQAVEEQVVLENIKILAILILLRL